MVFTRLTRIARDMKGRTIGILCSHGAVLEIP